MYLISACMTGINCRYDGSNTSNKDLEKLVKDGKAIAVCPEVLGGLDIPREPCEIINENGKIRVVGKTGKDHTGAFLRGAHRTLEICKAAGIKEAVLQDRSPSCGCGRIYDGSFSGRLVPGNGITAKLLGENGIKILSSQDLTTIITKYVNNT